MADMFGANKNLAASNAALVAANPWMRQSPATAALSQPAQQQGNSDDDFIDQMAQRLGWDPQYTATVKAQNKARKQTSTTPAQIRNADTQPAITTPQGTATPGGASAVSGLPTSLDSLIPASAGSTGGDGPAFIGDPAKIFPNGIPGAQTPAGTGSPAQQPSTYDASKGTLRDAMLNQTDDERRFSSDPFYASPKQRPEIGQTGALLRNLRRTENPGAYDAEQTKGRMAATQAQDALNDLTKARVAKQSAANDSENSAWRAKNPNPGPMATVDDKANDQRMYLADMKDRPATTDKRSPQQAFEANPSNPANRSRMKLVLVSSGWTPDDAEKYMNNLAIGA